MKYHQIIIIFWINNFSCWTYLISVRNWNVGRKVKDARWSKVFNTRGLDLVLARNVKVFSTFGIRRCYQAGKKIRLRLATFRIFFIWIASVTQLIICAWLLVATYFYCFFIMFAWSLRFQMNRSRPNVHSSSQFSMSDRTMSTRKDAVADRDEVLVHKRQMITKQP